MDLNKTTTMFTHSVKSNRRTTFTLMDHGGGFGNQTFITTSPDDDDTTESDNPPYHSVTSHINSSESYLHQQLPVKPVNNEELGRIDAAYLEIMEFITAGTHSPLPQIVLENLIKSRSNIFRKALVTIPRPDLQASCASEADMFEESGVGVSLKFKQEEAELLDSYGKLKGLKEKINRMTTEKNITEQKTKHLTQQIQDMNCQIKKSIQEYPQLLQARADKIQSLKERNQAKTALRILACKNVIVGNLHKSFLSLNDEFVCADGLLCRTFNKNHGQCNGICGTTSNS